MPETPPRPGKKPGKKLSLYALRIYILIAAAFLVYKFVLSP